MGIAVSYSPESTFEAAGSPTLNALPLAVQGLMESRFEERFGRPAKVSSLLHYGIVDTANLAKYVYDVHPKGMPLDTLTSIMAHQGTMLSAAIMARQDPIDSRVLLDASNGAYGMSRDGTSLEIEPHILPRQNIGCPAVDFRNEGEPWPIFKKFIPWAGELALRSIMHNPEASERHVISAEDILAMQAAAQSKATSHAEVASMASI